MNKPQNVKRVVIFCHQVRNEFPGGWEIRQPKEGGPWIFLFGGVNEDSAPFVAWGEVES